MSHEWVGEGPLPGPAALSRGSRAGNRCRDCAPAAGAVVRPVAADLGFIHSDGVAGENTAARGPAADDPVALDDNVLQAKVAVQSFKEGGREGTIPNAAALDVTSAAQADATVSSDAYPLHRQGGGDIDARAEDIRPAGG